MIRRTRQSRLASSKIASAKSAHVHSPSAARCQIPRGRSTSSRVAAARCPTYVGHPRWSATTATSSRSAPELEHRAHEVAARPAEQPRRADDPRVLAGRGLAVQLRPAVDGLRIRRIRLDVRVALAPVEHVVGGEVHERGAELGRVLRAADVDGRGALRVGLRPVHVRPGRRVQHEVDGPERRRRQRHVPLGERERNRAGKRLAEGGAELAAGAGYDDASRAERIGDDVLQRWRTRSSSHGIPRSSGFAGSYSSVTR